MFVDGKRFALSLHIFIDRFFTIAICTLTLMVIKCDHSMKWPASFFCSPAIHSTRWSTDTEIWFIWLHCGYLHSVPIDVLFMKKKREKERKKAIKKTDEYKTMNYKCENQHFTETKRSTWITTNGPKCFGFTLPISKVKFFTPLKTALVPSSFAL